MVDFNQILASVTIRDILADAGLYPTRKRMACPIHKGDNPTAFSFTESTFCCFACGAKGGLIDLAQYLFGYDKKESLRYLCRKAGMSFEEAAQLSLATFRRDSDPPDVSENILQVRQALKAAKDWAKRTKPVSDDLLEAQNRLERLKPYHECLHACLRNIRKAAKNKKTAEAKYLSMREWALAELEEQDEALNYQTWLAHQLEKKHERQRTVRASIWCKNRADRISETEKHCHRAL